MNTPERSLGEFFLVEGHPLNRVWQEYQNSNVRLLMLDFGAQSLLITSISADGTIRFRTSPKEEVDRKDYKDISETRPWVEFLGGEFGWGWITLNQQGYWDGLLLSFGG